VAPPSGRFIAQLFLVPGTIVLLSVLLLMMFHNLFGGGQTADQFVRQLDSPNSDIRWRAASDLAKTLAQPDSIALRANPDFALELTERLGWAITDLDEQTAQKPAKQPAADANNLKFKFKPNPQQEYVSFLAPAVARMHAPLAIPLLCQLAQRPESPDRAGAIVVRRQALWALAIIGDNLREFPRLPADQQTRILDRLEQLAMSTDKQKSGWGCTALSYLDKSRLAKVTQDPTAIVQVDRVLAGCAQVDDPVAREMVALALRFWEGELVLPTLRKLARDDGHGQLLQLE